MAIDRDKDPDQKKKQRTIQQNRALHLYCAHLAAGLNAAGFDMKRTLKQDVDIPWNAETVKEYLWRPIQKAQLMKHSTTELTTKEIDEVMDTLTRHLGEKTGVYVEFPNIESLIHENQAKEQHEQRG
jgi:hypothetical protein